MIFIIEKKNGINLNMVKSKNRIVIKLISEIDI